MMTTQTFDNTASDPFSDAVLSHLFNQKYEASDIDFKETIDTSHGSNFPKIARHFFGMSNYGGGFLLIGFRQKETGGYDPVGLQSSFHIDQAELQGKFNGIASIPLAIGYREMDREVNGAAHRFAVVYVPPAPEVLVPISDGKYVDGRGKVRHAFEKGEILIRRGTSTSRATPHEIAWIQKRAKNTSYRISLLSGQPDLIEEKLVANVFPAAELPQKVYTCTFDLGGQSVPHHDLSSCLVRGNVIHSFEDPSRTPLVKVIRKGSLVSEPLSEWMKDPDRSRLIMQLLESSMVKKGNAIGLSYDDSRKRFFFPLKRGNDKREETWPGITRKDSRQVVVYRYLPSLKEKVGIHQSIRIDFLWLGGQLYLRMEPGFLLTEDGERPLHGPKQGNVLISLESWLSSLNSGYLRSILFWKAVFQAGIDYIELAPQLKFDANPLTTKVAVGIREDTIQTVEAHRPSEIQVESARSEDA
jgi:hypothetical protein